MLINKYSLGLQYLVTSFNKKYLSLLHTSSDLIRAITTETEFPPLIIFWRSGKKGVTDRKFGMTPTGPGSSDQSRTLKNFTAVSLYFSKTQVPG